jgi:hypothetical protein
MGVISKMPSGSSPAATNRSEITRLVEVPITVITPPSTAANDSGIRYTDGDAPVRRAQVTSRGATSATSGVLGNTADMAMVDDVNRSKRARSPDRPSRGATPPLPPPTTLPLRRPSSTRSIAGDNAPVNVAAPASTYSAPTVIGALDDNPDNAWACVITPANISTPTAAAMAAAVGIRPEASTTKVPTSTTRVIHASALTRLAYGMICIDRSVSIT